MNKAITRTHNGSTFERSICRRSDYQWTCITHPRATSFWEERGPTAKESHPYYTYTGGSMRLYFRTFEAAAERCQKYARRRYEQSVEDAIAYNVDLLPMIRQAMVGLPQYEEPLMVLYWSRPEEIALAKTLWPNHKHLLRPKMPGGN